MAKKISITYVIADSSLTGAPKHLLSLVQNLPKKDFAVSVILPQGPLSDELKKNKVPVFNVPMSSRSDMASVNAVKRLLTKYDPDIMHAHGSRAGLIGRMAVKGLPIKVIYTEHTRTKEFKLDNPVLEWAHLRAMRMLDKTTDLNIAVSKAVANFLLDNKITSPSKIKVIYNGILSEPEKHIDSDTLNIINQHGLRRKDILIGTIGSLNIQKDTTTLIKAMPKIFKKLPTARLVVVGSGPLKNKLTKLSMKLGLDGRAVFTGSIKDIPSILQVLTVFVLPSKSESFGISILEAMRAGVPVIATKVGGIPEIITNNQNGLLVSPNDPKQLSATIMKLLNDHRLQKKLIEGGKFTVKKFSVSNMLKSTIEAYKELLKK